MDFEQFAWILHAIAAVLLLKLIVKLFHIDFLKLLKVIVDEFKDLSERNFTVGAINLAGLIFGFVIGIAVIGATEFEKGLGFLNSQIGPSRTESLAKSVSFQGFVYVLFLYAIISVVACLIDRRGR